MTAPIAHAHARPAVSRSPAAGRWAVLGLSGPAALLLVMLTLFPVIGDLVLACFEWTIGAPGMHFVGIRNYVSLFHDELVLKALLNSLTYAAVLVPTILGLGLGIATLIESRTACRSVYRAIYLLPVLAAFPAMAMAWEALLNPTIGPLNLALKALGFSPPNWLADPDTALWTFIVMGIWQHVGLAIILFIGALKGVPQDLYDAAAIDGAHRPVDRFLTVTLPNIAPTVIVVGAAIALRAMEMFDKPLILTGGGPNFSSETIVHAFYVETFVYFHTGYGAAIAAIFLCLAVVLTIVRRWLDGKVHYQ